MTYDAVTCFPAAKIGERFEACVMWPGECGAWGLHCSREPLTEQQWAESAYWSLRWEHGCDRCGVGVPWDAPHPDGRMCCDPPEPGCTSRMLVTRSGGRPAVWDTPSGTAEPGAMYFTEHYEPDGPCWPSRWTNCDGRHLTVVLPNGHAWERRLAGGQLHAARGHRAPLLDPLRRAADGHRREGGQHLRRGRGLDPVRRLPRLPP